MVVLRTHGIEEKNKFNHAVPEAEYEILINLVKGEFNTPVKERTQLQKKCNYQILEEQYRNIQWTILHKPCYFIMGKGF